MVCGVKYCGGCNPRYDRTGFFDAVRQDCRAAEFQYVRPEAVYDSLLVICGCPSKCADISAIEVSGKTLIVSDGDELSNTVEAINKL